MVAGFRTAFPVSCALSAALAAFLAECPAGALLFCPFIARGGVAAYGAEVRFSFRSSIVALFYLRPCGLRRWR